MAKLVIFDLDGTLINTIADLGEAVNHSLSEAGFPTHSMQEYKMMVGNGVRRLVQLALPEEFQDNDIILSERLESFVRYYTEHIDVYTRPYPGMHDLLLELSQKGVKLAVASNKFQAGTEKLIGEFFGDIPFVAILGNSPELPLKPSPEVVYHCRQAAGIKEGESIIHVGDSATDVQTGKNAGIPVIGVTWGFRSREELQKAGASVLVDTPAELYSVLFA